MTKNGKKQKSKAAPWGGPAGQQNFAPHHVASAPTSSRTHSHVGAASSSKATTGTAVRKTGVKKNAYSKKVGLGAATSSVTTGAAAANKNSFAGGAATAGGLVPVQRGYNQHLPPQPASASWHVNNNSPYELPLRPAQLHHASGAPYAAPSANPSNMVVPAPSAGTAARGASVSPRGEKINNLQVIVDGPNVMRWTDTDQNGKNTKTAGDARFLEMTVAEAKRVFGETAEILIVLYKPTYTKIQDDPSIRRLRELPNCHILPAPGGTNVDDFLFSKLSRRITPESIVQGLGDQFLQQAKWTADARVWGKIVSNDLFRDALKKVGDPAMKDALRRAVTSFCIVESEGCCMFNVIGDNDKAGRAGAPSAHRSASVPVTAQPASSFPQPSQGSQKRHREGQYSNQASSAVQRNGKADGGGTKMNPSLHGSKFPQQKLVVLDQMIPGRAKQPLPHIQKSVPAAPIAEQSLPHLKKTQASPPPAIASRLHDGGSTNAYSTFPTTIQAGSNRVAAAPGASQHLFAPFAQQQAQAFAAQWTPGQPLDTSFTTPGSRGGGQLGRNKDHPRPPPPRPEDQIRAGSGARGRAGSSHDRPLMDRTTRTRETGWRGSPEKNSRAILERRAKLKKAAKDGSRRVVKRGASAGSSQVDPYGGAPSPSLPSRADRAEGEHAREEDPLALASPMSGGEEEHAFPSVSSRGMEKRSPHSVSAAPSRSRAPGEGNKKYAGGARSGGASGENMKIASTGRGSWRRIVAPGSKGGAPPDHYVRNPNSAREEQDEGEQLLSGSIGGAPPDHYVRNPNSAREEQDEDEQLLSGSNGVAPPDHYVRNPNSAREEQDEDEELSSGSSISRPGSPSESRGSDPGSPPEVSPLERSVVSASSLFSRPGVLPPPTSKAPSWAGGPELVVMPDQKSSPSGSVDELGLAARTRSARRGPPAHVERPPAEVASASLYSSGPPAKKTKPSLGGAQGDHNEARNTTSTHHPVPVEEMASSRNNATKQKERDINMTRRAGRDDPVRRNGKSIDGARNKKTYNPGRRSRSRQRSLYHRDARGGTSTALQQEEPAPFAPRVRRRAAREQDDLAAGADSLALPLGVELRDGDPDRVREATAIRAPKKVPGLARAAAPKGHAITSTSFRKTTSAGGGDINPVVTTTSAGAAIGSGSATQRDGPPSTLHPTEDAAAGAARNRTGSATSVPVLLTQERGEMCDAEASSLPQGRQPSSYPRVPSSEGDYHSAREMETSSSSRSRKATDSSEEGISIEDGDQDVTPPEEQEVAGGRVSVRQSVPEAPPTWSSCPSASAGAEGASADSSVSDISLPGGAPAARPAAAAAALSGSSSLPQQAYNVVNRLHDEAPGEAASSSKFFSPVSEKSSLRQQVRRASGNGAMVVQPGSLAHSSVMGGSSSSRSLAPPNQNAPVEKLNLKANVGAEAAATGTSEESEQHGEDPEIQFDGDEVEEDGAPSGDSDEVDVSLLSVHDGDIDLGSDIDEDAAEEEEDSECDSESGAAVAGNDDGDIMIDDGMNLHHEQQASALDVAENSPSEEGASSSLLEEEEEEEENASVADEDMTAARVLGRRSSESSDGSDEAWENARLRGGGGSPAVPGENRALQHQTGQQRQTATGSVNANTSSRAPGPTSSAGHKREAAACVVTSLVKEEEFELSRRGVVDDNIETSATKGTRSSQSRSTSTEESPDCVVRVGGLGFSATASRAEQQPPATKRKCRDKDFRTAAVKTVELVPVGGESLANVKNDNEAQAAKKPTTDGEQGAKADGHPLQRLSGRTQECAPTFRMPKTLSETQEPVGTLRFPGPPGRVPRTTRATEDTTEPDQESSKDLDSVSDCAASGSDDAKSVPIDERRMCDPTVVGFRRAMQRVFLPEENGGTRTSQRPEDNLIDALIPPASAAAQRREATDPGIKDTRLWLQVLPCLSVVRAGGAARTGTRTASWSPTAMLTDAHPAAALHKTDFSLQLFSWTRNAFTAEVTKRSSTSAAPAGAVSRIHGGGIVSTAFGGKISVTPATTSRSGYSCFVLEGFPDSLSIGDRKALCSMMNAKIASLLNSGRKS